MRGEASYDELAAARTAAWYAAGVARYAARTAAWYSAWDSALDAAWVAERKVKGGKGYSHERAWQIETLKRLIVENEAKE